MAHEDLDPQLFFKLDDGFGYTWLRREENLSGMAQIEILAHSLAHEA